MVDRDQMELENLLKLRHAVIHLPAAGSTLEHRNKRCADRMAYFSLIERFMKKHHHTCSYQLGEEPFHMIVWCQKIKCNLAL